MGRDEVKQRPRKNGEQDPAKPATEAKTTAPHQTKKHDKVEESSSETLESPRELTSEPGDLPDSYGETRVVLLPVEPYLVHVYWEVTFVELEKAKHRLGDEYGRSQAILRCYDITNITFDGTNAHSSFDVHIDLKAKNRYVHLRNSDKSYFVELGFKTEDSQFYPIARSNIAETPRARPAPKSDEHYMLVAGDYDLLEAGEVNTTAEMRKAEPASESLGSTGQSSKEKKRATHKTAEPFCDIDLTEMSEKRFTSGVSSKLRK